MKERYAMQSLHTKLPEHRFTEGQKREIRELSEVGLLVEFQNANSRKNFYFANRGQNLSTHEEAWLHRVIVELINDPNIALLLYRQKGSDNLLKVQNWLMVVVRSTYHSAMRNPQDFIIFPSTPHGLESYVIARVFEKMDIPVLILNRTFSNNYLKIRNGVSNTQGFLKLDLVSSEREADYKSEIDNSLNLARSTYNRAIPDYEKKRIDANRGKIFSIYNTAMKNLFKVDRTLHTINMWRELKKYSLDTAPKKYVLFFLQYQPERTSLPEAGVFCNQFAAIQTLRAATPSDTTILVREHPSTYSNRCDKKWRWRGFYSSLSSIDGVVLGDIGADPFKLIDGAKAVATLTGTVAFEAHARGVPAIFFGKSFLPASKNLHEYNDFESLAQFLVNCTTVNGHSNEEDFANLLVNDFPFVFRVTEKPKFNNNQSETVEALKAITRSTEVREKLLHLRKNLKY